VKARKALMLKSCPRVRERNWWGWRLESITSAVLRVACRLALEHVIFLVPFWGCISRPIVTKISRLLRFFN
jgi:hypothetical protein